MADQEISYLDYRIIWRAGGASPGRHRARQPGHGGDLRSCLPFWQLPDAARIDVRRSIMDVSGGVMVRQTEQRSAIDVVLAVDVSRSMSAQPVFGGLAATSTLARAAAASALRAGDRFGLLAFDETVRENLCLRPGSARGVCNAASDSLARFQPVGRGSQGLLNLAAWLPARRSLLILVSDFLLPEPLLEQAMDSLARHDVAPIVLHARVIEDLPRAGILRLRDAETGLDRLVLLRPGLRRRWVAAERQRRDRLDRLFARHCRAALHLHDAADIARVSEHLMSG